MIVTARTRPEALREKASRVFQDGRRAIFWRGHLYLPGLGAGLESVTEFARRLDSRPLAELAAELRGVFGLLLWDEETRCWHAFVDGAGQYKLYYAEGALATGFLELLGHLGAGAADLEREHLASFLLHGDVLFGATFVRGVRKLGGGEIATLPPEGALALQPKHFAFPSRPWEEILDCYFAHLARSFAGLQVSLDLTGGLDSRLLLAVLHHLGAEFELAVSGAGETADVRIARRIARMVGLPLHHAGHDLERLEEEIPAVFLDGDAQIDLRRFHRDRQNARARLARGIQLIIHGGGGGLFRDFPYIQDFPFYGSRRLRIERFYELRMIPVAFPAAALTDEGQALMARSRAHTLEALLAMRAANNAETYRRIAYFVRYPGFYGAMLSAYINAGLDVVTPYLEREMVEIALTLPPWKGFFHRWHREVTTRYAPELAALPSTEGYTASSRWLHLVGDLAAFTRNTAQRAANKLAQRHLGRTPFILGGGLMADAPDFIPRLRRSSWFPYALARLGEIGLLRRDCDPAAIPDVFAGRLLTLGLFLGWLAGDARIRQAAAARPPQSAVPLP